ncbi:MAG: hypothetical protein KJ714_02965 [Euryarchaeota archaeon]|nr:hypothetical protein [Euryarchaeota archaeon]
MVLSDILQVFYIILVLIDMVFEYGRFICILHLILKVLKNSRTKNQQTTTFPGTAPLLRIGGAYRLMDAQERVWMQVNCYRAKAQ